MRFSVFAKRFSLLAALLVFPLVGGCVRTAHPILKDEQVTTNDALLGKWVSSDGKDSAELRPGDGKRYKLTYIDKDGGTGHFLLRFGKIGDVNVAELTSGALPDQPGPDKDSLLLPLYSFIIIEKNTENSVTINAMSSDWLDKYLKDHPDELEAIEVGGQDGIINSSTEDFQAFFTRHLKDNGMLGKAGLFVRPGDPTTQPVKH